MDIDETLMIIIIIVFIVGGVLQIILFFKLWGMTNDIREFRKRYIDNKHLYED